MQKLKLIYFSPTGTTQKVVEGIAAGIAAQDVAHINLTDPQGSQQAIGDCADELVILGAPVYGGRLPVEAIKRFRALKADNTPAVVIVVYGNRDYEDSLLELKDLAIELGFNPVAGGAFIGEHSFATEQLPIANGRPDSLDIEKAKMFGAQIRDKVAGLAPSTDASGVTIPGRFPYEGGARAMTVAPVTVEDACTGCGTCATVCPTAAISVNGSAITEIEQCIRCCACIKACPEGIRFWQDSMMKTIARWLHENCSSRKEPQVFGVDV